MRPGGFEPPTNSLEGCCSIHLSYGRRNTAKLNRPCPAAQVDLVAAGEPRIVGTSRSLRRGPHKEITMHTARCFGSLLLVAVQRLQPRGTVRVPEDIRCDVLH